ncbi:MAG: trimeric intracellular cation channel family protein [Desulfarculaceae bacterium]|nr:trimeric intracellular cation channel family protein [Desulfarculaceae bacterium]MCF8103469.1 trimeric intracellular cation channel family protein [Desulfarculaceae bacterium]MCF8117513.1 trimeric intracellular cation channel family protein [Desulfarculaceae bacterium]
MDPNLFFALEMFGTVVFAISGAMSAGRQKFDLSGVILVACVVGVGGGTIRDLVLGYDPVFWVSAPVYLGVAAATGAAFFFLGRWWEPPSRLFLWSDAVGLGVFMVGGAAKTLEMGFPAGMAVLMGVLTAVGGGFMRDVICGQVPLILRKEIYATAALAGALVLVALKKLGLAPPLPSLAGGILALLLRLAAIRWDLHLPAFRGKD